MLNAIAMTVDKKDVITISKWKVMILIPALVSFISAVLTVWGAKAELQNEVLNQKQEINKLFDTKVDRSEQTLILKSLERIEAKLDGHIDKE
jgi:hypothetical protein